MDQLEEDSQPLPAPRDKVYTVDEAINKIGFGPFQLLISVFLGVLLIAGSMEIMILSVLSPALKCQWDLSGSEEALITSAVFAGSLLGGLFWGVVCDILGRRNSLFLMNILILLFGVLSALRISPGDTKIPGYPWLLLCRFGVGFASGGLGVTNTYFIEFLPVKSRGICVVLVSTWFSVGTLFGAGLAVGVLGSGLGWHWFLGLASLPFAPILLVYPFIPESARFYLVKGELHKAEKVIKRVAWFNFKEVPKGRLVTNEEKEKMNVREDAVLYSQGTVTILDKSQVTTHATSDKDVSLHESCLDGKVSEDDNAQLLESEAIQDSITETSKIRKICCSIKLHLMITNGMWKTTLIMLSIIFFSNWLYFGIVLLTTTFLQYDAHCGIDTSFNFSNISNDSCEEYQLHTKDYLQIMWASAAEFPGVIITTVLVEVAGRKKTLAIQYIASTIAILLLFVCASDSITTFFFFIIRIFITGAFLTILVYTPEVYPTEVRGLALGVLSAVGNVGGITTPYVAQVLLVASDYATIALYAFSSLVLVTLSILLPIETKGRPLPD